MLKTKLLTVAVILTGCATHNTGADYRPIIDTHGKDPARLQQDLSECQAYAHQVSSAAERAAAGAVVGALLGAVFAAAAGAKGYRNESAAVGALSGGLGAAVEGERDQRNIIRRCMSGRGYSVLN
jgi:outer membrane lipoprotein SlyB